MTTLVSLIFQGEVKALGPLDPAEEREVERQAFPLSPPRDAALRPDFRAFKVAPLASGRVLVSVVANRGDRDGFKRPVLRADGCLFEVGEMSGALRDLTAVWAALGESGPGEGVEAFEARVAALSIHTAPEAFARAHAELVRSGPFYARLAAALREDPVDLCLGSLRRAPERLCPALGLLPLAQLRHLHLVLGGERSEVREPILGLAETAPADLPAGRPLADLLRRQKTAVTVDFEGEEVYGSRAEGPQALVEALTDPRPWPDGSSEFERYQVLIRCLDAPQLTGRSLSPFEAQPALEELRDTVRRIEQVARELKRWR